MSETLSVFNTSTADYPPDVVVERETVEWFLALIDVFRHYVRRVGDR